MPEDPAKVAVGRLARRLLAEAEARPELIGRSVTPSRTAKASLREPFPAMALLSDPALDIRQYLEDLVTIAVNSAQQAEGVSLRAELATRRARRGMAVVASLGALGLMVGIAGFAASRSSNVRLSEVRDQVSGLQEMQRQAQDQLADIAARAADQREAEVEHPPIIARAAVLAQPLPPPPQQAVHYYPQPWPDSRPVQQRRIPVTHNRPVVVPQFFADIQHSFRAIFR